MNTGYHTGSFIILLSMVQSCCTSCTIYHTNHVSPAPGTLLPATSWRCADHCPRMDDLVPPCIGLQWITRSGRGTPRQRPSFASRCLTLLLLLRHPVEAAVEDDVRSLREELEALRELVRRQGNALARAGLDIEGPILDGRALSTVTRNESASTRLARLSLGGVSIDSYGNSVGLRVSSDIFVADGRGALGARVRALEQEHGWSKQSSGWTHVPPFPPVVCSLTPCAPSPSAVRSTACLASEYTTSESSVAAHSADPS